MMKIENHQSFKQFRSNNNKSQDQQDFFKKEKFCNQKILRKYNSRGGD